MVPRSGVAAEIGVAWLLALLASAPISCSQAPAAEPLPGEETSPAAKEEAIEAGGRCWLAPVAGPCRAAIEKVYFDAGASRCLSFHWGGCEGVVPFETIEDCEAICLEIDFPEDVQSFLDRRLDCEHFLGEEAYDEERGRFLEQRIRETCAGSDSELERLRHEYGDDPKIVARLAVFEAIEMAEP